jgi:hypothetical protein
MQRLARSMQVEWGTIIVYADDGSLAIAADSIAQLMDRAHAWSGFSLGERDRVALRARQGAGHALTALSL